MPMSMEQIKLLEKMFEKMSETESVFFKFLAGDRDDPRWGSWLQLSKSERSSMLEEQKALRVLHQRILANMDELIPMFKQFQELRKLNDTEFQQAFNTIFGIGWEMHAKCMQISEKIDQRYEMALRQLG